MKRKTRLAVGLAVVLLAVAYLVYSGFAKYATYYLTVDELVAKGPEAYGKPARVSGTVVGGSIRWDPGRVLLSFEVTENGKNLAVVHRGIQPDNFGDGKKVILEGKLGPDNVFLAEKVMTVCPSKYEEKSGGPA